MVELFDLRTIPLWTAFFAALVSFVGLIIAKEHRVSDFRQAWIDALRGEIASLIARMNVINESLFSAQAQRAERKDDGYALVHPDVLGVEEALAKIELRLNPTEPEAQPVLEKARALVELMKLDGQPVCRNKLKRAGKALLEVSKPFLKAEWGRVKKGEFGYRCAKWTTIVLTGVGVLALVIGTVDLVARDGGEGTEETVHGTPTTESASVEVGGRSEP